MYEILIGSPMQLTWCNVTVLGMLCGNSASHRAISVSATKNSFTADLISDNSSNMGLEFGMSAVCKIFSLLLPRHLAHHFHA